MNLKLLALQPIWPQAQLLSIYHDPEPAFSRHGLPILIRSSRSSSCHLVLGLSLLLPPLAAHYCLGYPSVLHSQKKTQPIDPSCLDHIYYVRFSIQFSVLLICPHSINIYVKRWHTGIVILFAPITPYIWLMFKI